MDVLSTIFGSEARVKIMRLFLFNSEEIFDVLSIAQKSQVNKNIVKRETKILEKAGLIQKKSYIKIIQKKKGKKIINKKQKIQGYTLNQEFAYITALQQLLIKTKTLEGGEIVKRLGRAGKLKLVIIAGVFTQDKDSRVDMFVVGNNLKKSVLNTVVKSIEAELGKELVYVCFETPDYQYRLSMYDKLIRDVLDYPHQVLLDKITV